MNTVIFKWNPNFSSYTMSHYLEDITDCNCGCSPDFDWSVWDYEKIHKGDRFYWLKLGNGGVGIVGRGTITSEPHVGEDWSGNGRKTYYVDFEPELLINPDTLPILTSSELGERIPDFDWTKGHSGAVLNRAQAERLDKEWDNFVAENEEEFKKKLNSGTEENDYLYWNKYPRNE
jgi:hypothetical protein